MPTKKKTVMKAEKEITETAFNKGAQLPVESNLCGHINKQFVNQKGYREDLACTLPKGHTGDHFAIHVHVVEEKGISRDPKSGLSREAVTGAHEEMTEGWWSDAAGEYPKPPDTTREQDFERVKKARAREHSKEGYEVDEGLTEKIDAEVKKAFG